MDEVTADPDALAALSNDEINQKIGEIVIGSLDGVELAATQPITITYTKVDGTWEPASSTSGDIAAALMTNYNTPSTANPLKGAPLGRPSL